MQTIVIIEDDELNHKLLVSLVRSFGYSPISARTGVEGLTLIRQHQPALILLDLRLPGMDGWELVPLIRGDPPLQAIPIFALTVEVSAEDKARALAAGCNEYLPKPFRISDLEALIHRYLG